MLTNFHLFRILACLFLLLAVGQQSKAAASLNLAESPLFVGSRATPMVMLNTSRDHQLFYKAYNDYTDLDLDGTLDTSYLNTFDYYGYFDSYKCYTYDIGLGRFIPVATASGSAATVKAGTSHYCTGATAANNWSGNFLNWLSMSRIDVMRKVLYGGYRSTDSAAAGATPSLTVLERANIPTDGHAWAKYYANTASDIQKLTPFASITSTATTYAGSMTGATAFVGTVSQRKAANPNKNAVEQATVLSGNFLAGDTVSIASGSRITTGTVVSYGSGLLVISVTSKSGADSLVGDSVTITNSSLATPGGGCSNCIRVSGIYYPGDQIVLTHGAGPSTSYGVIDNTMGSGYVSLANLSGAALPAAGASINVSNRSRTGVSFCNLTAASSPALSHSTDAAPILRAAQGNYALWGANEKWQCYWRDEKDGGSSTVTPDATNGNTLQASGMPASRRGPLKAETGLALSGVYDFTVRVEVCKSGFIGQESCKPYGTNLKPTGLLQLYGEGRSPRILFGLMTPSYTLNVSGGVLRKALGKSLAGNVDSVGSAQPDEDEIDPNTGQFKTDSTKPGGAGIIYTLNKLRIDAYDYNSGTYKIGTTDCDYQRTGIVPVGTPTVGNQVTEGHCSSWGNPMSELYMESLRYLAGKTPTPGFTAATMSRDDVIGKTASSPTGLKQITTWADPINAQNYCAPLSMLVFNASVSTNDRDQVGGFADLLGAPDAATQTDKVGTAEGLVGKSVFIGNNGTINNGICTAKNVAGLGSLGGICPEAPSQSGSYMMAGMAYYAHTNRIRNVAAVTVDPADTTSLRVKTYGVALATNVPRIPVKVGGKTVYIQPAYRLDLGASGLGTGTIVDFKVVSQTATTGTFYVNWEDSNFGGDYDQDVIGTISYEVLPSDKIRVTTKVISESTANPQGFGYVIAGTNHDGPHFHSGIRGFTFTDASPGDAVSPSTKVDCRGVCNVGDASSSVDYTATTGSMIADLKDPLYYASKYGGFKEFTAAGKAIPITISSVPDQTIEWDAENKDGDPIADGQPDTYFYVIDPAQLEKSLARAFQAISKSSGGATVATSSSTLDTGVILYQGQFDPGYWTGDLLAYEAKEVSGSIGATLAWSAASKLTSNVGRKIFTANPLTNAGLPFQWGNLSLTQQRALEITASSPTTSAVDQGLVEYIRGNAVNEGSGVSAFRTRDTTKLGDIINSAPIMIGTPGSYGVLTSVPAAYAGDPTYASYAPTRTNIVYVGANDGMLHAFDATTNSTGGNELFAYVPSMVIPNLKQLVSPSYTHKYFVDGSPVAADVKLTVSATSTWRTVLAGALGASVRGLYALDVTSPDTSSESNVKDSLIWEFTHSELGYVVTRPVITRLKNGKWALITGNGYNSNSGKAQLFIIYLDQKGVAPSSLSYLKIDTGVGSTTDTNGLGGVTGIDSDNDGYIDYVYGGDLQGNMWKFDLNDPSSVSTIVTSKLGIACRTSTATCTSANLQPITSAPALAPHPINDQHVFVYFGTGKFLENSDIADKSMQSMYGIWDQATTTTGARTTILQTRDKLLTQTFSPGATTAFRQISNLPIDWSTQTGWVEDLTDSAVTGSPNAGERITGAPVLYKKALFYATFVPSELLCGVSNAHGWLTVVNYENGGLYAAFDINGDGKIEGTELAASKRNNSTGGLTLITSSGSPIAITSKTSSGSTEACTTTSCSSSGATSSASSSASTPTCPEGMECVPVGLPTKGGRRLSWREVIKPE